MVLELSMAVRVMYTPRLSATTLITSGGTASQPSQAR
jgi:hypothetical protein